MAKKFLVTTHCLPQRYMTRSWAQGLLGLAALACVAGDAWGALPSPGQKAAPAAAAQKITAPAWFDQAWPCRRPLVINNQKNPSPVDDYPIKISLSQSELDFSRANSGGKDLRFTDSDGVTLLEHWIESFNASAGRAVVWVKIPHIAAVSSKTIYLYYGNPGAGSVSSGARTFDLFDDFDSPKPPFTTVTIHHAANFNQDPSIVKAPNGDLLTAWVSGTGEVYDDMVTKMARSTDGGLTWSDAQTIHGDLPGKWDNSAILWTWNQTVYLFSTISNVNEDLGLVYYCTSADSGRTWSEPVLIDTGQSNGGVFHKPIILDHGDWVLPYQWSEGNPVRFHSGILLSTDQGKQWTEYGDITYEPDPTQQMVEGAVIQRADQALLLVLRTTVGKMYQSVSTDRGRTWSAAAPTAIDNPGSPPNAIKLASGRILLAYNDQAKDLRYPIRICLSMDDGKTYSRGQAITFEAKEVSYMDLLEADGKIYIPYNDAGSGTTGKQLIKLAILTEEQLIKGWDRCEAHWDMDQATCFTSGSQLCIRALEQAGGGPGGQIRSKRSFTRPLIIDVDFTQSGPAALVGWGPAPGARDAAASAYRWRLNPGAGPAPEQSLTRVEGDAEHDIARERQEPSAISPEKPFRQELIFGPSGQSVLTNGSQTLWGEDTACGAGEITLGSGHRDHPVMIDRIFVRKYASPEPSVEFPLPETGAGAAPRITTEPGLRPR